MVKEDATFLQETRSTPKAKRQVKNVAQSTPKYEKGQRGKSADRGRHV